MRQRIRLVCDCENYLKFSHHSGQLLCFHHYFDFVSLLQTLAY